ncbi:multidrug resistance protein homolog 65 isoform X3 [Bradysia coprophila]|uniref:multidrug resistance protein homolog 65 isoform X3 n=1 Tax=Bradysia coprophila TaxID=38358 RepID=UPI00187DAA4C|nr:multidrug resistance protein homolog 65 isoform X3 [Bradysia coprophila]
MTKKNDFNNAPTISYFRLYRFATPLEFFLIFLGIVFTTLKSFGMPLMIIVYGEFTTLLVDRTYENGTSSNTTLLQLFGGGRVLTKALKEENNKAIIEDSIAYGILMTTVSVFQFVMGIFSVDLFNYTAIKQITRIRIKYFSSMIRQEVGWFDCASSESNVAVRISEDIEKIREGIAEKVSHFLCLMIGFVICVALSFSYGWKLTLVVIGYVPILLISNMIIARFQSILTAKESNAYASASSVSEEVLGGIRTVVAFSGEKKESERYNKLLIPAQKSGIRKGLASGIGEGIMRFMFYAMNSLAYWYGVSLVLADRDKIEKEYTPAVLMITFFGLIVGAENISRSAPFLECFAMARGAAATIFKVIDRKSNIDPMSGDGKMINYGVKGDIEFQDVGFHYPSRTDVQILDHLSARFTSGQTVALVGSSGNGKSTCLQLLQRFYDPTFGRVLIDGQDIRSFNISWLRSKMAFVGQEPALFATTIEENIRYGKPDASRKEIEESAKMSGAHDFIVKLQDGYQTLVGERGCQLSGGQKQRIAISRALIQNPTILLLDEATSALDTDTERLVQDALDKASKGRTTIVVSHRLSAIRNADRILFIEKGKIVEDGTHDELIKLQGSYYNMMRSNNMDSDSILPSSKLVQKQMFAESQQIQDSQTAMAAEAVVVLDTPPERIHHGAVFKRILLIARPEWFFLFLAFICALIIGASIPAFSILFGEFYGALATADPKVATETTNSLCVAFLVLGILIGVAAIIQTYMFNMAGVYLTTRIRARVFGAMIRQDMAWFDDSNNSVGALSVRLTSDAATVQGAIGYPLSGMIQSVATFVFGVSVAFAYIWKMALVILPTAPLVIFSVLFEGKYMANTAEVERRGIEEIAKLATEAISNIRTVASLRQEPHIIARYCTQIAKVERTIRRKLSMRGLVNSLGQSIPFFGYSLALYYGGRLVAEEGVPFQNIIKVSESLLYGTMMLGQSLAFAPAFTAAFAAGHRLFQIVDRESRIRSPGIFNLNRKPDKGSNAKFEQINFNYPTRPNMKILQNINLDVPEGKTVALVGPSGCGKSTCIQLLQRLYDPDNGRIYLGLDEISRDIALPELRSKLSIVSQEPILFDRTIAENIAYGDNSRAIDMSDVIDAAKTANIHDFIVSLPMGYETKLGSKGTQLSGGQKQRVSIARALVRNPKVLLLDEATSALDIASEKVVQTALDIARTGRTCLVIAHRLSTIQNADLICVIQNGAVCEQGTHNQLMALGGLYSRLYSMQPSVE